MRLEVARKVRERAEDARQKRGHDVEAREHADLPAKRVLDRAEHVAAPHVVLEALDTARAAAAVAFAELGAVELFDRGMHVVAIGGIPALGARNGVAQLA